MSTVRAPFKIADCTHVNESFSNWLMVWNPSPGVDLSVWIHRCSYNRWPIIVSNCIQAVDVWLMGWRLVFRAQNILWTTSELFVSFVFQIYDSSVAGPCMFDRWVMRISLLQFGYEWATNQLRVGIMRGEFDKKLTCSVAHFSLRFVTPHGVARLNKS